MCYKPLKRPIARAYLAYISFFHKGASFEVNDLMNGAIRAAFNTKRLAIKAPFDYTATYDYRSLNQLLLHLSYVQGASPRLIETPCWVFQRHPQEAANVYHNDHATPFAIQNCSGFDSWEEVKVLQAIAADLNVDKSFDTKKLGLEASARTKLYLLPKGMANAQKEELKAWSEQLMKGLNQWATKDPLNAQLVQAFKLTYYQTQVLLEDYYMDKGFNVNESKGLALKVMQTLVNYHLARFQ